MRELIGKRFELTEVVEADSDNAIMSLTLVSDDEVIRLEPASRYYLNPDDCGALIAASIESLVDPPSEEVKTDVFGGNFVATLPVNQV